MQNPWQNLLRVDSVDYKTREWIKKILTQLAYRANGNKLWYIGQ